MYTLIFWDVAGIAAGVVLGAAGLWLLRGGKRTISEAAGTAGAGREGLTGPTRLTIGIVCLLVGYHCVMWVVPALTFGVPLARWWLVATGAVLAVCGAFAVDLVESEVDSGSGPGLGPGSDRGRSGGADG